MRLILFLFNLLRGFFLKVTYGRQICVEDVTLTEVIESTKFTILGVERFTGYCINFPPLETQKRHEKERETDRKIKERERYRERKDTEKER